MQNQHLLGDVRVPMEHDTHYQKQNLWGSMLIGVAVGLAFVLVGETSSVANFVTTSRVVTGAQPRMFSAHFGQPSVLNHVPMRVEQAAAGTPEMTFAAQQSSSLLAPVAAFFAGCLVAVAGLAMRFQQKPHSSSTGTVDIHALASIGTVEEMSKAPDVLGDDPDPNSLHRRMEAMLRAGQDSICKAIEECDGKGKFRADAWQMPGRGGGISRVLADGNVWEKAGINLSVLKGKMPQEALSSATEKAAVYLKNLGLPPGEPVPFFVASLSCVMHPRNPHCPTMHFNYRYFELDKDNWWFAGGTDITPAYLYEDDMKLFHGTYKKVCDKYDKGFYPKFKKQADDYFLIKHRGETRGLGGIFFDDLNDRDPNVLFEFAKECLNSVAPAYVAIIEKHKNDAFTEEQKQWQLIRRGRYTEFNLVYDRGTIFGLKAGGRIESILMTLPETARWEYDHRPAPGSEEEKIMNCFKNPRDWV